MGVKSRVGPRVQIERSLKNGVLALVVHTAVERGGTRHISELLASGLRPIV
jgi:hypothetical protein